MINVVMINLYRLRMLIVIFWMLYLGEVLSIQIYDSTLYSPILHLEKILIDRAINLNYIFYSVLVVESALLLYSSSTLWFGYLSGKWTYIIYLLFSVFDNIFLSVQAFSWLDMIFITFGFIISGVILLALFTPPLKEDLAKAKPFCFWKIFFTFFIFFILFFTIPIMINYS